MAIGSSGRIVIEINPETKQALYKQLKNEDLYLKQWFLDQVDYFLKGKIQLPLALEGNTDKQNNKQEKSIVK